VERSSSLDQSLESRGFQSGVEHLLPLNRGSKNTTRRGLKKSIYASFVVGEASCKPRGRIRNDYRNVLAWFFCLLLLCVGWIPLMIGFHN